MKVGYIRYEEVRREGRNSSTVGQRVEKSTRGSVQALCNPNAWQKRRGPSIAHLLCQSAIQTQFTSPVERRRMGRDWVSSYLLSLMIVHMRARCGRRTGPDSSEPGPTPRSQVPPLQSPSSHLDRSRYSTLQVTNEASGESSTLVHKSWLFPISPSTFDSASTLLFFPDSPMLRQASTVGRSVCYSVAPSFRIPFKKSKSVTGSREAMYSRAGRRIDAQARAGKKLNAPERTCCAPQKPEEASLSLLCFSTFPQRTSSRLLPITSQGLLGAIANLYLGVMRRKSV